MPAKIASAGKRGNTDTSGSDKQTERATETGLNVMRVRVRLTYRVVRHPAQRGEVDREASDVRSNAR